MTDPAHPASEVNLLGTDRREARAVEITLALLLGSVVVVLPTVAMWLAGRVWDLGGPGWSATRHTVQMATLLIGATVTVVRLVRSPV